MALHPHFPISPYEPLLPDHRWFPADEALRENSYEKLLPPLVEAIQSEGVTFERVAMGEGAERKDSLIVEVETDNPEKNPDSLDIPLPKLSRRYVREFKDLSALDPATFGNKRLPLKSFTEEETRKIIFKKMLDSEIDHTIHLDSAGRADWRSVVAFFARQLLKELRLVGGYEFLYPTVRDFVKFHLFEPRMDTDKHGLDKNQKPSTSENIRVHPRSSVVPLSEAVDLEDPVILRNLSEPAAGKLLFDTFKAAINALTIRYGFLYVDQKGFEKHKPQTLADLAESFTEYKP